MQLNKWFLTLVISTSLVFTAITSHEQFPTVASIGLPLLAQALNQQEKQNKD